MITLHLRARPRRQVVSGPPNGAAERLEQITEGAAQMDSVADLVSRRFEAIEIVYNSRDADAAVTQLMTTLAVSEAAARTFVYSRISRLTEGSRKDHDTGRRFAQRDIERLTARLDR